MRKNSCMSLLLVASLVLSALVVAYRFEFVAHAEDQGLLDGIDSALDWCDRDYCEIGTMISNVTGANVSIAIARSGAFLDFRLKDAFGNWTISGKMTNVNLPPSATMIRGGGRPDQCANLYKLWFSPVANRLCVNWTFDTDGDTEYDDLQVYTEMGAINNTFTGLYGEVMKKATLLYFDLYLEFDKVIINCTVGKNFTRTQEYGWWGRNYYMRPAVKGLADLYMQCQSLGYGASRGINYTDRAYKLYATFYGSGYTIDRFDGMYNVTLLSRPFPQLHGGLPPDPDLVLEKPWDFFDSSTHSVAGYYDWNSSIGDYDQTWYNYSDVLSGGGYADPSAGNTAFSYLWRHPMESRVCMPDDTVWNNAPFRCSDSQYAYCYRSRTGFAVARNAYIGNGFVDDIVRQYTDVSTLPPFSVIEGISADSRFTRLCQDLFKYGDDIWYGMVKAKEMLDHVVWDGNGIPKDEIIAGSGIGWPYCAYCVHTIVPYLIACCLYYQLTGDVFYADRADEVAGVLLGVQIDEGVKIYSKDLLQDYYMPSEIGGFLSGYMVAHSFGQAGIHWQDFTSPIYATMSWWYDVWHGAMGFKFDNFNHMDAVSAESSIPATWALMFYRLLNRTPKSPSVPAYYLPMDSGSMFVLTDRWGSLGGDGNAEVADQYVNKTHIGGSTGNLDNWTGAISKFRMASWGGFSGWSYGFSTVEFVWPKVDVAYALTDFAMVVHFSMPEWVAYYESGANENYINVNATVYDGDGNVVITDTRQPLHNLNGESGGTGGKLITYDDLCGMNVLPIGTYRMSVKFTAYASGQYGLMHSGFACQNHHGIPMGLEWVGYNWSYPMYGNSTFACRFKNDDYGSFVSLLNNSGFETGSLSPWVAGYGAGVSSASMYGGSYSLKLNASNSNGWSCCGVYQNYDVDVSYYSDIVVDLKVRPLNTTFWNPTIGYAMFAVFLDADLWNCKFNFYAKNDSNQNSYAYYWHDDLTYETYEGDGSTSFSFDDDVWHNCTFKVSSSHRLILAIDETVVMNVSDGGAFDHYACNLDKIEIWDEVYYARRDYYVDNTQLSLSLYFPAQYKLFPVGSNTYWDFWTLRSSELFMSSNKQFLNITLNHDFNITAFYHEYNYTYGYSVNTVDLTGAADIKDFDGQVDGKDNTLVALVFGKWSGSEDWKSSQAEQVDDLMVPDNKIDGKELTLLANNFGNGYDY